jgi:hypothetical protein
MRYFDSGTSIKNDSCALSVNDLENESIFSYNTFNSSRVFGDCKIREDKIKEMSSEYPNLRYRIGYGQADSCYIGEYNKLANSKMTHGPEKMQLFSRNFVAGPDLSTGILIPQIESQLQQGYSSICDSMVFGKMAEVDFDRFTPLNGCLKQFYGDYYKSIPKQFSIGQNSRNLVKDPEYIKKCGFYKK